MFSTPEHSPYVDQQDLVELPGGAFMGGRFAGQAAGLISEDPNNQFSIFSCGAWPGGVA
jgi:hypothetical protein